LTRFMWADLKSCGMNSVEQSMRTKCIIIMVLYINQRIRRGKKKKNYTPRPRNSETLRPSPFSGCMWSQKNGEGAAKLKFSATIIKSHLSLTISFDH